MNPDPVSETRRGVSSSRLPETDGPQPVEGASLTHVTDRSTNPVDESNSTAERAADSTSREAAMKLRHLPSSVSDETSAPKRGGRRNHGSLTQSPLVRPPKESERSAAFEKEFERGKGFEMGEVKPGGLAFDWKTPDWLAPENWPTPRWYENPHPRPLRGYRDYFRLELRSRYAELEGDYRSVCGNYWNDEGMDRVTAGTIADLLHRSRPALEQESPDLLSISSILDLVERYMVWTYPRHILDARIAAIELRIEKLGEPEQGLYRKQFTHTGAVERLSAGKQRSFYDEVIAAYNRRARAIHIGSALQIERLKVFLRFGYLLLALFLLVFPLVVPIVDDPAQSSPLAALNGRWAEPARVWLLGTCLALMGATGAFISGLIQVRQSGITLSEYEESMLKLAIRPMLGASLALLLYVFLAWQVIAGVEITNRGSYFLVAFLAGFSERYFLRLLDLRPDDPPPDNHPVQAPIPIVASGSPAGGQEK